MYLPRGEDGTYWDVGTWIYGEGDIVIIREGDKRDKYHIRREICMSMIIYKSERVERTRYRRGT